MKKKHEILISDLLNEIFVQFLSDWREKRFLEEKIKKMIFTLLIKDTHGNQQMFKNALFQFVNSDIQNLLRVELVKFLSFFNAFICETYWIMSQKYPIMLNSSYYYMIKQVHFRYADSQCFN
jgi:hypothetical protein